MLSKIILQRAFPIVVWTVLAFALVGGLLFGVSFGCAVLAGGLVVSGSAGLQVWLVGYLFDAEGAAPQKAAVGFFLLFKLAFVGALLWGLLTRFDFHPAGLLVGMGLGLAAAVASIHQASMTKEAQAAMEVEATKIGEKMEDIDPETR